MSNPPRASMLAAIGIVNSLACIIWSVSFELHENTTNHPPYWAWFARFVVWNGPGHRSLGSFHPPRI